MAPRRPTFRMLKQSLRCVCGTQQSLANGGPGAKLPWRVFVRRAKHLRRIARPNHMKSPKAFDNFESLFLSAVIIVRSFFWRCREGHVTIDVPQEEAACMRLFGRFRDDQSANVAVIFSMTLVPVIALGGAAVDYSRASQSSAALQSAV